MHFPVLLPLFNSHGSFADPVTKIIELGTTHLAALINLNLEHIGAVYRKNAFATLTIAYAPDSEISVEPATSSPNDDSLKNLRAFFLFTFVALLHSCLYLDSVTHIKI